MMKYLFAVILQLLIFIKHYKHVTKKNAYMHFIIKELAHRMGIFNTMLRSYLIAK